MYPLVAEISEADNWYECKIGTFPLVSFSSKRKRPQRRDLCESNKMIIVIAVILLAITVIFLLKDKILRNIYPQNYKEIVNIYAEEYGVDENLIFAVIKAEAILMKMQYHIKMQLD